MMRSALLWASENQTLRETFPRYRFARAAVKKFMPGEKFEDAFPEGTRLNGMGAGVIFTRLGENVLDKAAAQEVADHYAGVFATLAKSKGPMEISIKPTQLGLDLSPRMVERARAADAAGACEYRLEDACAFRSEEKFDYIVMDYLVGYLPDVQACLESLRVAALPGPDGALS